MRLTAYLALAITVSPLLAHAQDATPTETHANALAAYNVGIAYEYGGMYQGRHVPKDAATADEWFRKAAEGGDADAQVELGVAYEHGRGVSQDYMQAIAIATGGGRIAF